MGIKPNRKIKRTRIVISFVGDADAFDLSNSIFTNYLLIFVRVG
jgi:hypothetical protein